MECSIQQCIRLKFLWAFLTIVFFVGGCFLFEHMSHNDDEHTTLHNHNMFFVKNATLTNFTYTNTTNILHYNLTLQLGVPIKFTTLQYMSAAASYHNITFATQPDETLVQGFIGLNLHFKGQRVIAFTKFQHSELNKDSISRLYNITVKLWPPKMNNPAEVLCDMQVPMRESVLCDWIK